MIKHKLQLLSESFGNADEEEGDISAVCDLADDVRDAIVEYQVSIRTEKYARESLTRPPTVLAAERNLQAKLQIDCELRARHFERNLTLTHFYRTQVRHGRFISVTRRLKVLQPSCPC